MTNAPYLEPSPIMRELFLLECLEQTPYISQSALADRAGLAPAMVNTYIRRFHQAGLITLESKTRGLAYHLTTTGSQRLNYHRVSYRAELVELIRSARSHFQAYFESLAQQGIRSVVLYGAGETGTVILDSLVDYDTVTVLAVIDDDPSKHGLYIHGVRVQANGAISVLKPDAVVITSVVFHEAIFQRLSETHPHARVYSIT